MWGRGGERQEKDGWKVRRTEQYWTELTRENKRQNNQKRWRKSFFREIFRPTDFADSATATGHRR